ncbi:MAG TPA: oligopeptide/dipeptide ABC transporter ATP-binding protein [Alphaproteobacteria bacterium]|jgi:oligopeptide/dipeptide ABC transporter ATP-binding protein
MSETPLLHVAGLTKSFALAGGRTLRAVDGVSFDLAAGETLALVGESGSGKTTCARTIARLYRPDAGEIRFRGTDMASLPGHALRPLRRHMQMMFQDPFGSLNPRLTVGASIAEPLVIHRWKDKTARAARVAELMGLVGLPAADAARYPHEFSGGQRQRIAIARMLALEPELIVADEPLSALDVSIQSQILNLLQDLQARLGFASLFISHDLAVVDAIADRVAVMYLGRIVEIAPRERLFAAPRHPYTQSLIDAVPQAGRGKRTPGQPKIAGDAPDAAAPPSGCAFHPRCPRAQARCRQETPQLTGGNGHLFACHYPLGEGETP